MSGSASASQACPDAEYPQLAVSIVVFRNGQVLLAQRVDNACWSLPGGRVEAGETLAAAALRELSEETGVQAIDAVFSHHHEIIARDETGNLRCHYVIAVHAAQWAAGEGEIGVEARQIGWFAPEDFSALSTTDGLAAAVKQAQAVWMKHRLKRGA
ncbi:NUDIX hydrolase [Pseudochelatococcus sp. G4_1912]|uniref:NUDIX hydrolase n=1 Tax=Pseudochelatococcus sp. G4_1912 TaxID=3114288 RepID=UPI0039C74E84